MVKEEPPHIIDIEASGFGGQSYPIEVGVVLSDGQKHCQLIRPHEDWISWSSEAENIHGISRETLEQHGASLVKVAADLNRLLAGKTIYSDCWVADNSWLITLFDKARLHPSFYMYDIMTIFDEGIMECWHQVKEQVVKDLKLTRHRASNDAYIIQQTYDRARQLSSRV